MTNRLWPRLAVCLAIFLLGAGLYARSEILSFLRTRQCQQGTSPWATPDSWFCQEARVSAWLAGALMIAGVVAGVGVARRRKSERPQQANA